MPPLSGIQIRPELNQPTMPGSPNTKVAGKVDFQDMFMQTIAETNNLEHEAQDKIDRSLLGEDISQVEVLSAVKKADLSLRLLMQIRNKIMEAYQEVQQLRM